MEHHVACNFELAQLLLQWIFTYRSNIDKYIHLCQTVIKYWYMNLQRIHASYVTGYRQGSYTNLYTIFDITKCETVRLKINNLIEGNK